MLWQTPDGHSQANRQDPLPLASGTDGSGSLRLRPWSRVEPIAQRFRMTTNATQAQNATVSFAGQPDAAIGLALVRMTIGAMFVWVFFENLGKGAYTPAGYAGVINYYIKGSHSPAAWKAIMGFMASHAA